MYKLQSNNWVLKYNENGSIASIPFDPANTDYQAYLKWVEEGNLPYPADYVEPSQASVTPLPADQQGEQA